MFNEERTIDWLKVRQCSRGGVWFFKEVYHCEIGIDWPLLSDDIEYWERMIGENFYLVWVELLNFYHTIYLLFVSVDYIKLF